jgi:single-strand DNA-binding protein
VRRTSIHHYLPIPIMNSCILMAEIIKNPELRYTADNQMAVADMFVQFAPPLGSRPDDQHPTIEVVGWGNLATEMKENYKQGDRVTIEGRLEMNTIERDGYKEKRARLVANRIHHVIATDSTTVPVARNTAPAPSSTPAPTPITAAPSAVRASEPPVFNDADVDQIPF